MGPPSTPILNPVQGLWSALRRFPMRLSRGGDDLMRAGQAAFVMLWGGVLVKARLPGARL